MYITWYRFIGWAFGGMGLILSGLTFKDWQMYGMISCFALSDVFKELHTDSTRESK